MKKNNIITNMIDYTLSSPERTIVAQWCLLSIGAFCVVGYFGLGQVRKYNEKEN